MFAGFNFKPNREDLEKLNPFEVYTKLMPCHYNVNKTAITAGLKKYLSLDGSLDAAAMEKDWFPEINAQVFISHSHQDENLANQLALWLYEKHGIVSFIDSTVWHYADDLLREIDEAYCIQMTPNGNLEYDYIKRNRSTAHVHMLLQCALAKMIDKCESFIFINTANSTISSDRTLSPWIYSELLMANILRRRLPERHEKLLEESTKLAELKIAYPAYHKSLQPLTLGDIDLAKKATGTTDATNSEDAGKILDQLYINKGLIKR